MATIAYNGFSSWKNLSIDSYSATPVYADDGISRVSTEHVLRGAALISETTQSAFDTTLTAAHTKLVRDGETLDVNIGSQDIFLSTDRDDMDGPQGSFEIRRVVGALAAHVGFQIKWWQTVADSGETIADVISHTWTQEFVVDASGNQTRTVAGTLIVRANTEATGEGDEDEGNNPDAWRKTVMPELISGFRRERMSFATDKTGNRLLYIIEDREYPRDIPSPAYTGNGRFSYHRDIGNMMGIKRMEVEFAAPRSVGAGELLNSALKCIKNRIDMSGEGGADNVISIEIVEPALFRENRVRLSVVAWGTDTGLEITPNFDSVNDVMSGLEGYEDHSPYGDRLVRSVRRALSRPEDSIVPKAEHEDAIEGAVTQYTFDDPIYDEVTEQLEHMGIQVIGSEDHDQYPYTQVHIVDRINVIDTGVRWLKPNDLLASDISVQVRRPTVFYRSETVMARNGRAPDRLFNQAPFGSIVRRDEFHIEAGPVGVNNEYTFVASHLREVELGFVSGPSNGFSVIAGWVQFWPAGNMIQSPRDPRIDNQFNYPVGPSEPYRR